MVPKVVDEAIGWLKKSFSTVGGLAMSLALLVLVGIEGAKSFGWMLSAVVFGLAGLATIGTWVRQTRIPIISRDRIGILLALVPSSADDDTPEVRAAIQDFLVNMRTLADRRATFQVLALDRRRSIQAMAKPDEYSKKAHALLLLYGIVRRRRDRSGEVIIFELGAFVRHRPINEQTRKMLVSELNGALGVRMKFNVLDEIHALEFTSASVMSGAKLIVAIAACVSGDTPHAQSLLEELCAAKPVHWRKQSIESSANRWLCTAYELGIQQVIERQDNHWTLEAVRQIDEIVRRAKAHSVSTPMLGLAEANALFRLRRDVTGARNILKYWKTKLKREAAFPFSLGFLFAYTENFSSMVQEYDQAFRREISPAQILDIEAYIEEVYKEDPSRYGLLLCLGLINLREKGDLRRAEEYLTEFRARCSELPDTSYRRTGIVISSTALGTIEAAGLSSALEAASAREALCQYPKSESTIGPR